MRTPYSRALAAWDLGEILTSLDEEVTIHVAVHAEPLVGKATAEFLFGVLLEELTPFELRDELVEGDMSVVSFDTTLRGEPASGLNVVRQNAAGKVVELTVFFRPLAALELVAEVIGGHMERRFGPRDDVP